MFLNSTTEISGTSDFEYCQAASITGPSVKQAPLSCRTFISKVHTKLKRRCGTPSLVLTGATAPWAQGGPPESTRVPLNARQMEGTGLQSP